ncbi:hypothetical protein AALB39_04460 [Lachnospiraceae bacterium 54-53]
MIKFNKISQIEKEYFFEDAVTSAAIANGDFGAVTSGSFAVAANATKAVMQVEVGDNADLDVYPIASGTHVRVIDLVKIAETGKKIEVYGNPLPATYAKGDKLASDATGKLAVTASPTGLHIVVDEIIGNKLGIIASVVAPADGE